VGDVLAVRFALTGEVPLRVVGIHERSSLLGNWIVSARTFAANFPETAQFDQFGAARLADDVSFEEFAPTLEAFAATEPGLRFQDQREFERSQRDQLEAPLVLIYLLLGLSVVVAMLGILNTLFLAIFERTRELGLLRAVGMTRRQLRRMIRWEAVVISLFGAVVGVALGLVFGLAVSLALPSDVVTTIAVPWGTVWRVFQLAVVVGLLAAILPAWRASRLNVLEAIAYE
jgi:putative ABC transport system permease protein